MYVVKCNPKYYDIRQSIYKIILNYFNVLIHILIIKDLKKNGMVLIRELIIRNLGKST